MLHEPRNKNNKRCIIAELSKKKEVISSIFIGALHLIRKKFQEFATKPFIVTNENLLIFLSSYLFVCRLSQSFVPPPDFQVTRGFQRSALCMWW